MMKIRRYPKCYSNSDLKKFAEIYEVMYETYKNALKRIKIELEMRKDEDDG